jgi:predicted transcriptional regulator
MTTVRLPEDLEEKLEAASKTQHKSKSLFVREALARYFTDQELEKSSWEVGEPYFGNYGSGEGDLSTTYKERIWEKINAKFGSH